MNPSPLPSLAAVGGWCRFRDAFDTALTMAPLRYEFSWGPKDYDLLAAGIDPTSFVTAAGAQTAAVLNGEITRQATLI